VSQSVQALIRQDKHKHVHHEKAGRSQPGHTCEQGSSSLVVNKLVHELLDHWLERVGRDQVMAGLAGGANVVIMSSSSVSPKAGSLSLAIEWEQDP